MSIVSMKKMSLVAHKADRSRLMKIFMKSGCVELSETPLFDMTEYPTDTAKRDNLESKKLKVGFAITFLKETLKAIKQIDKDNKLKANFKKENRLIPLSEYETVARDEMEIFSRIAGMEKINSRQVDIKSERARITAVIEQLSVYKSMDLKFTEIKDTATCKAVAGTVSENKLNYVQENLPEHAEMTVYGGDKLKCVSVVYHKDCEKEALSCLAGGDFIRCSFDYDATAEGKIAELNAQLSKLEEDRKESVKEAVNFLPDLTNLKILYDYYTLEIAKFDAVIASPHTKKAFVMEGWVPSEKVDSLTKEIDENCKRTEIAFRDPFDDETPPTLTKNNKVVSQFDGITDMFGAPNYRERDPNIFVALFYFMFFGIMISDAGYGLIMAIACFTMVKIMKPVKKSGQMLMMFGFCGISTVIWGAMFGGWFGIQNIGALSKIQWFSPLDDPLKMFMLALGMGVLQIGTGFFLKGLALCKEGHPLYGIFNQFSWVIIFIGLILISPKLMLFLGAIDAVHAWYDTCMTVGMYVALAGFVMLIIGGALGKKNPLKMAGGAFKNMYGAINVVSDLLSYSRLFGLGLTTGVIGYVVNMLADIIVNTFFGGLWVGWIVAAVVLVIGHSFNIAINLLGAYVHNSRLQYIEFFGRFYEGSGRAFKPLGNSTRYTYLDN